METRKIIDGVLSKAVMTFVNTPDYKGFKKEKCGI